MSNKIKQFYYLIILIFKINWFKVVKLNSKKSENILWVLNDNFSSNLRSYITGESFLKDLALINSFVILKKKFRIVFGKNIGKLSNKNIYYNISKDINVFSFKNHSETLLHVLDNLKKQKNNLFPPYKETLLWENKRYMHDLFQKLNINTPNTKIINSIFEYNQLKEVIKFPCLLKDCNSSASEGIYKILNFNEGYNILKTEFINGPKDFLVQDLINMRKDLRVILVDDEIILHYWRINKSKEWKPTSTSHGSNVNFSDFPDKWKSLIINEFKKLNISTGGFDITWENDDINTKPIFLEVSPTYYPNSSNQKKYSHKPYIFYKNTFSYRKDHINLVFKIKEKVINYFI